MKKTLVIALVAALFGTAAMAQPAAVNLWVEAGGEAAVTVGPGCGVPYYVIGELTDVSNMGLALVGFDLEFDGPDLVTANAPAAGPMASFVIPDGITNPEGYGGTIIGGSLIQVGGGQNTIMNGQVDCSANGDDDCPTGSFCGPDDLCDEVATFPVGEVVTGVALFGYPEVLVTGELTAPASEGTYTLQAANLFANVIKPGQDGNPFWATEAADAGTLLSLSITVQNGEACPTAAVTTDPPNGAIDARQPHAIRGNTTPIGWDSVEMSFSYFDVTGLVESDLMVAEYGGDGTAPEIKELIPVAPNVVRVTFWTPIEPGAWTEISHPSGLKTCLGYLPGDASQNGTSEAADIDALIALLNSGAGTDYATDINRSETGNAQDILRLVDLLNGADDFDPWISVAFPASSCP